jgi:hypothetical protein
VAQHIVAQGDCIMSIAANSGYLWETIWNHADNAQLKELRKSPNILLPGDVVVIPDKTPRVDARPTDATHKFVLKTELAQVRLRLLDHKRKPRPNIRYAADVDGAAFNGSTDADGYITLKVKSNAQSVTLNITDGSRKEQYTLPLGSIDPVDQLSGVQQRLVNLGYPCDGEEGTLGPQTQSAVRAFQAEMNLDVTGQLDNATRQKLEDLHGS